MTDDQYDALMSLLTEIRDRLPIPTPRTAGDPLDRLRSFMAGNPDATPREIMRRVRPYRTRADLDTALRILAEEG